MLHLLCWALLTLLVHGGAPPREQQNIYAVELTMTGAIGVVSFPNGTSQHLASIEGSESYAKLMSHWYRHMTNRSLPPDFDDFNPSRQEIRRVDKMRRAFSEAIDMAIAAGYPEEEDDEEIFWPRIKTPGWKKDVEYMYTVDYYRGSQDVEVLTDLFRDIKTAMFDKLGAADLVGQPERPYLDIAVPVWMIDLWMIDSDDEFFDHPPTSPILERISTAAHRSGFRRSLSDKPTDIILQIEVGERYGGPVPASFAVLETYSKPSFRDEDRKGWYGFRPERAAEPKIVLNYERMHLGELVTLWADSLGHPHHLVAKWSSWTLPPVDKQENCTEKFDAMAEALMSAMSKSQSVGIVLTGSSWTPDAATSLYDALGELAPHLVLAVPDEARAALGTVREARRMYNFDVIEEEILKHRRRQERVEKGIAALKRLLKVQDELKEEL